MPHPARGGRATQRSGREERSWPRSASTAGRRARRRPRSGRSSPARPGSARRRWSRPSSPRLGAGGARWSPRPVHRAARGRLRRTCRCSRRSRPPAASPGQGSGRAPGRARPDLARADAVARRRGGARRARRAGSSARPESGCCARWSRRWPLSRAARPSRSSSRTCTGATRPRSTSSRAVARRREPARLVSSAPAAARRRGARCHPVHAAGRGAPPAGLGDGDRRWTRSTAPWSTDYLAGRLPGERRCPRACPGSAGAHRGATRCSSRRSWTLGSRRAGSGEETAAGASSRARSSGEVPDSLRQLIRQRLGTSLTPSDRRDARGRERGRRGLLGGARRGRCERSEDGGQRRAATSWPARGLPRPGRRGERWPDGTIAGRYAFTHDLCQEVLYEGLPAGRRARLHRGWAPARGGDGAAPRDRSGARQPLRPRRRSRAGAVSHLRHGRGAGGERRAPREALGRSRGPASSTAARLPEGATSGAGAALRGRVLGPALIATQGWLGARPSGIARAGELAEAVVGHESASTPFRLATLYETRGEYARSEELLQDDIGARDRRRPLSSTHRSYLPAASSTRAPSTPRWRTREAGPRRLRRRRTEPVIAAYGDNPGVACHSWAALSLWHLGRPDRALERARPARRSSPARRRQRHGRPRPWPGGAASPAPARTGPALLAEAAITRADERGYVYRWRWGGSCGAGRVAPPGRAGEGIAELRRGSSSRGRPGREWTRRTSSACWPTPACGRVDGRRGAGGSRGRRARRCRGRAATSPRRSSPARGRAWTRRGRSRAEGEDALAVARRAARGQWSSDAGSDGSRGPTRARGATGRSRRGGRPPSRRLPGRGAGVRYAQSGELNIAYQVTGTGRSTSCSSRGSSRISSWTGASRVTLRFLERLGAFSRLIRFDKRGTGLSDRAPAHPDLETRMDDVRAVMDAAGSERAVARRVLGGRADGGAIRGHVPGAGARRWCSTAAYAKRVDPDEDYPWAPTAGGAAGAARGLLAEDGAARRQRSRCAPRGRGDGSLVGRALPRGGEPGGSRALIEMNSAIDVRDILRDDPRSTLVVHRTGDMPT